MGRPRRRSAHGDARHLRHVQPDGAQLLRAGEHLARACRCMSTCRVAEHERCGLTFGAISSMRVADHDDGRAACARDRRGYARACSSRPARVKPRRRLVEDQHLRLHGDHARDGHAALLSAGELKGRLVQHGPRAGPPSSAASRTRRSISVARSGPCCSGRRRCPCRPSPQRADTPDTGTPAPPGSAPAADLLRLGPDVLARRAARARPSGCSRPLRCWISVDLPEPGVADDAEKLPRAATLKIHIRPRRGARRASRRCRYGSGSLYFKIGSNGLRPFRGRFPERLADGVGAHSSTEMASSGRSIALLIAAHTAAPPSPARSSPSARSCSTCRKTSRGGPSSDDCSPSFMTITRSASSGLVHVVGDEHDRDALARG